MLIAGQVFTRWTVVSADKENKSKVICECNCGTIRAVSKKMILQGRSKSCGCLRKEVSRDKALGKISANRLPSGLASARQVIASYKKNAKQRDLPWNLTEEEALSVMKLPCLYCGLPPSNEHQGVRHFGAFRYSGIDRLDNLKGYELVNVAPCCKPCNWAKGDRSLPDFLSHVLRLSNQLLKVSI